VLRISDATSSMISVNDALTTSSSTLPASSFE